MSKKKKTARKPNNRFDQLVADLVNGDFSHNHIQMAYRESVRQFTHIPDATKSILCGDAESSGLLFSAFKQISATIGALELAWRRGYQAGKEEAEAAK